MQAPGLGSSAFARRYLRNHGCFLFLRLLRCFSSPGSLRTPMYSVHGGRSLSCRVAPFRYLRLSVYLPLPAAFRSLSRLSSALSAKASALRPTQLDQNEECVLRMTSVSVITFTSSFISHIELMVHLITTFSHVSDIALSVHDLLYLRTLFSGSRILLSQIRSMSFNRIL